jgi:hypothetical protein
MRSLFTLLLAVSPFLAGAQLSNGLIAHWPFNGNANDASGKNHNGTVHNLISVPGKTGQSNTAYYFAGDTSSYITVPYQSDLNVGRYSIAAVIKPMGFYTGLCQQNIILQRGTQYQPGSYLLGFFDNATDSACTITGDTSHFTFCTAVSNIFLSNGARNVPPYIHTNQWYNVVMTFTDSIARIYVNGALNFTLPGSSLIPVGTSTEGINIGGTKFVNWQQYPFPFKGVMDDLRIYDHALTQQEIDTYQTLAINDLALQPQISLSPNPTDGTIRISAQLVRSEHVFIEVVNMLGQVVYTEQITPATNQLDHSIELGDHPNGQYILRLTGESGGSNVSRFIFQQ